MSGDRTGGLFSIGDRFSLRVVESTDMEDLQSALGRADHECIALSRPSERQPMVFE